MRVSRVHVVLCLPAIQQPIVVAVGIKDVRKAVPIGIAQGHPPVPVPFGRVLGVAVPEPHLDAIGEEVVVCIDVLLVGAVHRLLVVLEQVPIAVEEAGRYLVLKLVVGGVPGVPVCAQPAVGQQQQGYHQ